MSTTQQVGPIIFGHETARGQLEEHGEVVTFRKRDRTTGDTWWRRSRTGRKCGDVNVRHLRVVDPSNEHALRMSLPLSGFETVRDWREAIADTQGELPEQGHLYHVTSQ